MIGVLLAAAVGYLSGAVPFSYLAGRMIGGIDLREHGSGNLGASNTFRMLGPRVALVVLFFDIAKGFIPTLLSPVYAGGHGVGAHWLMLAAAFGTICGHMFSIFVKFKGGKGIATSAGAFMALAPWGFLGAFAVFAVAFGITRVVSVGSILGVTALPVCVFAANRIGLANYDPAILGVSILLAVIIIVKHMSNIKRLLAGSEPRLHRNKS